MKNRLLVLNLALAALIAGCAWRMRETWLEARAREQRMFGRAFKPYPAPVLAPFAAAPAAKAANYFEVAEKVLFSRDRNPVVVVEAAPPKPMPPLPFFYGAMDLGQGPTIILAEKAGGPHRNYRVGETIGEFTIAGVDTLGIDFEWDGKTVRRAFSELEDRSTAAAAAAPSKPAAAAPAAAGGATNPAAPASSVLSGSSKAGPGPGNQGEVRVCQAGDDSPPGTVVDGYKKVVSSTPFGKVCRWEPAN